MSFEEFTKLVNNHDLTYSYSDDHRDWVSGQASYDEIRKAMKDFPQEDVIRVWNAMVDRNIAEGFRETFYWKTA